ncbi:DMT family transporter [Dongia soli]|uniref:DMT family transporter n=1 Tax=Dongia soli TaxID=600628 RepID=A0ABU5E813_9PROT|nr:DMT family transporter [Dongia soli]MDY0882448.1 DMT family transporter [Dongia soli]
MPFGTLLLGLSQERNRAIPSLESAGPPLQLTGVRSKAIGLAAALVTVVIWSGWIVATRYSAETELGPIDIGLLRYGLPAIVLAPVWWRCRPLPRNVPLLPLGIMLAGSGAPFLLIAAAGMRFAPAAEIGALLPGTMPLWAALIGCLLGTARFARRQILGYVLIGMGIAAIAAGDFHHAQPWTQPAKGNALSAAWLGHGLFLMAAMFWAAYSHAFKKTGLTALQAAAITAFWSFLCHLALAIVFGSRIGQIGVAVWLPQLLIQGGLSGLIAIVAYGIAVRQLGATRAAAFSALVPALTLLGGLLLLGESVQPLTSLATACVTFGVALATGLQRSGK